MFYFCFLKTHLLVQPFAELDSTQQSSDQPHRFCHHRLPQWQAQTILPKVIFIFCSIWLYYSSTGNIPMETFRINCLAWEMNQITSKFLANKFESELRGNWKFSPIDRYDNLIQIDLSKDKGDHNQKYLQSLDTSFWYIFSCPFVWMEICFL